MTGRVLSIDFETASRADLKKVGAVKYAKDPSTRVLCMAWRFDGGARSIWREGDAFPAEVLGHVYSGGTVRGWNVGFEHAIWNYTLIRQLGSPAVAILQLEQLDDTMARAAYWGLPLSLDQAGPALRLPFRKDKDGHALMLRMSRPRRINADGSVSWWHLEDPEKFNRLCDYCLQDVLVESEVASRLPPLPDRERAIWLLDKRINLRGVKVDLALADHLQRITDEALAALDVRLSNLTGGALTKTTQTARMLAYAASLGYALPSLDRTSVEEGLKTAAGGSPLHTLLLIRQESAKASTAKIRAAVTAADHGFLYGLLQHYGALRTGRWAGRIFQPQNLPRPQIKNVDAAIACAMAGASAADLELLFGVSPLTIVSACLRGLLIADDDGAFVVPDFSQIEARVNPWLAGQTDILDVFARGDDVYVYTAAKIGSTDRQLGKVMVLGLGFGMGPDKFMDTAAMSRVILSPQEAQDNVSAWRTANDRTVQFWWDCDKAARRIAKGERGPIRVGAQDTTFYRRGRSMVIRLPSSRELVYRDIRLETDHVTGKDSLVYNGVHQTTRTWTAIRTYGGKLVENIVQAVARDVMADAMLAVEADPLGPEIVLTVHDELIALAPLKTAPAVLDLILAAMRRAPSWAPGLPVWAEGWWGPRYRKG